MPDVIDNIKVGEQIKSLLKERNMTQSDLARELNISKSAVSQNLNGRSTFDIQNLMKIAEIFNISIDTLLNIKEDKNRNIVSEYERLVRKGYNEISSSSADKLNISNPDLYGKVFVEYVIDYDKQDIFEFLIQHNVKLYEPSHSNAREVQLKIISYMINKNIDIYPKYIKEYVRNYGSFKIINEELEKKIVSGLNSYPNQEILKKLFITEVSQEVTFFRAIKLTKKYRILSNEDWSRLISKYHADKLLVHLLNSSDTLGYSSYLFRQLIQYGFFDGINIWLKKINNKDLIRIRQKHNLAQELIKLVSKSGKISLFKSMIDKHIYNDLTSLTIELLETNSTQLYTYVLNNCINDLNFRELGAYLAKISNLKLLREISDHLTQEDLDYILSTTDINAQQTNISLLRLGAKVNSKFINKDTPEKLNKILSELIKGGH